MVKPSLFAQTNGCSATVRSNNFIPAGENGLLVAVVISKVIVSTGCASLVLVPAVNVAVDECRNSVRRVGGIALRKLPLSTVRVSVVPPVSATVQERQTNMSKLASPAVNPVPRDHACILTRRTIALN